MRISLIRNATLVIDAARQRIIVDPSLADKASAVPFAYLRRRPARNPTVALPANAEELTEDLSAGLVTHFRLGHTDHLDAPGCRLLLEQSVPVGCQPFDGRALRRKGIDARPVAVGATIAFAGGSLTAVAARHGHGTVGRLMGPGVGYVLRLPDEPSLYLSGDTVLTDDVRAVLTGQRPDVAVMHSGVAQLDIGKPILMSLREQLEFVRLASGRVIATHMEALNHCAVSRGELAETLGVAGLRDRVELLDDGASVDLVRA